MSDGCKTCADQGWVCEVNPDQPWGGVYSGSEACDCPGCAGSPCPVCNRPKDGEAPRWAPGTTEIWHKDKGAIH